MQNPIKERIVKVRDEIAQISEANRLYMGGGKKIHSAAGDHERRVSEIAGHLGRVGGADRLEKSLKMITAKVAGGTVAFPVGSLVPPPPIPMALSPNPPLPHPASLYCQNIQSHL